MGWSVVGMAGPVSPNDRTAMNETDRTPLASALLQKSIFFGQSAAAAYSSESWDVFYLHLATSVELLAKSVLAAAHPSFIADTRAGFDSLLHLSGFGSRAKTPETAAVRTITPSEALERVGRLVDNYREPSSHIRALIETRNGIVHGSRRGRGESDLILGEVAQYVSQLLATSGISHEEFWGTSAEMVAEHAGRRLDALEASYQRKVQAAKNRFAQITSPMEETSMAAFLAAVAAPSPAPPYDAIPARCPACGQEGELTGSGEASDWEADYDDDGGIPYVDGIYVSSITFSAGRFRCGACGLQLERDELDIPDLGYVILTTEQYDVSEASDYFARLAQEDWDS